ncbi:hypothetical protein SEA_SQUIDDLY_90 [Gordonia phage Squiddly]|nr:hypothetical protein SEA_SQUIDDLY_90 [Gordonia phage Squiddly]
MPRKRMLYPGFFGSDQMAQLSLAAAYTYEGIWCFADDRGRKLFNAAEVWAEVWLKRAADVQPGDVDQYLHELIRGGQLCRYRVGGGDFMHVVAWDEHQKISHPTASKLPPCPDHQPAEWSVWWKDDDTATDRWRRAEKESRAGETDSGSTPENFARDSGMTPPQCSSVQSSSVQASGGGKVRKFERPSQKRAGGQ